jgi:hypothetical protein
MQNERIFIVSCIFLKETLSQNQHLTESIAIQLVAEAAERI